MIKITAVDQLRVGDIIKEVNSRNNNWYLLEVFMVGGSTLYPNNSFTAQLVYSSGDSPYEAHGQILYPNPGWFSSQQEEFYVVNR